jgi:hypothetical protein
VQELDAQHFFKLKDLAAQGGLRDVNGGSRSRKAAGIHHRREVVEVAELKIQGYGPQAFQSMDFSSELSALASSKTRNSAWAGLPHTVLNDR